MKSLRKAAFATYLLAILGLLFSGVLYYSRSEFMPYHGQAARTSWRLLNGDLQGLLLALVHEIGGTAVALAIAAAAILWVPFRRSELWADCTLPAVLLIAYGVPLSLGFGLYEKTGAHTPWRLALGGSGIILVGAVCSFLDRRSSSI